MSDHLKDVSPMDFDYVRSESPCRTEYAVKDELFLEHCPLFASKKTIYWYRLIHPVEALHLGAEQQGEVDFHHSIHRPKKSLQDSPSRLCDAIRRRASKERRSAI